MAPETELWSRPIDEHKELWSRPVEAGESPNDPIDTSHPEVTVGTRQLINWSGGDPQTAVRYLQGKGFEAKALDGFNFAVRKPGEPKWQKLDSSNWEFQDVLDVMGDIFSLGGIVGGGLVGSPGLATGVAGAALGGAGAQGIRSGIGQMLGMPATGEEVARSIGTEAVMGAGAEVGGRIIGGIAKGAIGKLRGKPPAAPAAPAPAASKLAAGETAATEKEMLAAIEKLGPQEKFGVEFIEKMPAQTTRGPSPGARGAAGGTRRVSGEFQKEPPQSGEVRRFADEWAEQVAGKPGTVFSGESKEQISEQLYRRMLHGEVPAAGPGRIGPFVDVAKREGQILRANPPLVQTTGATIRFKGKLGKQQIKEVDDFLADPAADFWAKDILRAALKESPEATAEWARQIADRLDAAVYIGKGTAELFLKNPKLPVWAKNLLTTGLKKDPVDAANLSASIAFILRKQASAIAGAGAKAKQLVMPLGEPYWHKIPTGSDVKFWRDLPEGGIQKLFLPDGEILALSAPQAKAVKVIMQAAATDNWTPQAKTLLDRLISGLKRPREIVTKGIAAMVNARTAAWIRTHPIGGNIALGATEALVGGPAGGFPGAIAAMDIAGRGLHGIQKIAGRLLGDTSGKALRGLISRSTLGVPEALKKAAQAAGAGNEELYRSIMWTALKATDVNEYLQAVAGSRGVNAEGPRVRQGHGS